MIKKYFWYYIFSIFILFALINIYQKIKWNEPTDNIVWEETEAGLVCHTPPENCPIQEGDILVDVSRYTVKTKIDLLRILSSNKNMHLYHYEREEVSHTNPIPIAKKYTSFLYYILVFSGIIFLLLTLQVLNSSIKKQIGFSAPPLFYLLTISFAGFLIFSPTGIYDTMDFLFLLLNKISYLFFPAFLLQYSVYLPIKSRIFRKIKPRVLNFLIYIAPVVILLVNLYLIIKEMLKPDPRILIQRINNLRDISARYFTVFIILSALFFIISNLKLVFLRKRKKFILPLLGILISVYAMTLLSLKTTYPQESLPTYIHLFLLLFLPLSTTFLLSHKRFTNIENIIKKTLSTASIFLFIFGVYFFLGVNFKRNNLLGIFWSVVAILTAGFIFKPIEKNIHMFVERTFLRSSYKFKQRLTALIRSLQRERDLGSLSSNFLGTINKGFNLHHSALIIRKKGNIFFSLPKKRKQILSRNFTKALYENDNLVFSSLEDFKYKFRKDYYNLTKEGFSQFLPLKTKDKLIGLVALSLKRNKTYLSEEDWELLFNISSSLTLSVENASLYTELENQFNEITLFKEFNENIVNNINLGIVVLSKLNTIRAWNNQMEEKFKISFRDAINKKAQTILGSQLWKKIYRNKKYITTLNNIKIDFLENDLTFDIKISPLKDNNNLIIGTILVFEDITEKIRIQNQLFTSEKMASLGLLSAGIAHEINTPLTGISSYCQFLLENQKETENRELIERMQEQIQRANKIVRSLLDFSRQKGEQPQKVSLNNVINESLSLLEHKLKNKNITVQRDFNFQEELIGYPTRLQQIFVNLLINSTDAIEHSNGQISIVGQEDEKVFLIRFKDNGKGIRKKHISRIFDPFFTTKSEGKGTGLGLSIVFNIIEEHFGKINVNSMSNKGTTFYISFLKKSPLRSMKI